MSLKKFFVVVLTLVVSFTLTTLPALAYNSEMSVIICNESVQDINFLKVEHQWTNSPTQTVDTVYQSPTSQSSTILLIGQCTPPGKINVGSGGHDLWTITGHYQNGADFNREGKQCDVSDGDITGQIFINIFQLGKGFSIAMPYSSSCNDNAFSNS